MAHEVRRAHAVRPAPHAGLKPTSCMRAQTWGPSPRQRVQANARTSMEATMIYAHELRNPPRSPLDILHARATP